MPCSGLSLTASAPDITGSGFTAVAFVGGREATFDYDQLSILVMIYSNEGHTFHAACKTRHAKSSSNACSVGSCPTILTCLFRSIGLNFL